MADGIESFSLVRQHSARVLHVPSIMHSVLETAPDPWGRPGVFVAGDVGNDAGTLLDLSACWVWRAPIVAVWKSSA